MGLCKAFSQFLVPNDPAAGLQLATKQYVDAADALKAPLASPTFTGQATIADTLVRAPQALAVTTALSIDASLGDAWAVTATGSPNFNVPTNGVDGQWLSVDVLASGGTRTVAVNASILLTTGLVASNPIPNGKIGCFTLKYSALAGNVWILAGFTATQ